ncbi:transglutaminase family protein [Rhodococcus aerolatus]
MSRRLRIVHRTTYDYDADVTASYGRAHLRPLDGPGQRVLAHELTVEPTPDDLAESDDEHGNAQLYYEVTTPHRRLVVTAVTEVETSTPQHADDVLARPWEDARPRWSGHPDGPDPDDPDPATTARAVAAVLDLQPPEVDDDVRAFAAVSLRPGRPVGEALADLTHRIHTGFTYASGSTTNATRVAEVLAARAGVCQDFARLALACLRSHGLAARYVSGYLATAPPPGRERVVGADATHAWLEAALPGGGWLGLDPTNDCVVDDRYTVVARGRDFVDVSPLRGIIHTEAASSRMHVSVDVAPPPAADGAG